MRIAGTILMAAALALAGCKGPGSVQDANAKVAVFHRQLDAGDFEAIWREGAQDLHLATSKQDFTGLLGRVHAELGKVKQSKQTGWRTEVNTQGSYSQVTMDTIFEKGSGIETFVYRNADEGQALAGYGIKPGEAR